MLYLGAIMQCWARVNVCLSTLRLVVCLSCCVSAESECRLRSVCSPSQILVPFAKALWLQTWVNCFLFSAKACKHVDLAAMLI